MKNRTITVQGAEVTVSNRNEQDYISLTDMVSRFDGGSALIEQWLKNKDTILFLGISERINNPSSHVLIILLSCQKMLFESKILLIPKDHPLLSDLFINLLQSICSSLNINN
jgi:hypothetical protein